MATPIHLVSLSGGGYRAALYHAGALRALHQYRLLPPDGDAPRHVWVSSVSGGALPAMIWSALLRRCPFGAPVRELLPERLLLDLIEGSPGFGGRLNWWLRGIVPTLSWASHLEQWWQGVLRAIERQCTGSAGDPDADAGVTFFVQLLDFRGGGLWLFDGSRLHAPGGARSVGYPRTLFKYGGAASVSSHIWPVHRALAAATAFPIYFRGIRDTFDLTGEGRGTVEFVDAGLVDNLGAFALLDLLDSEARGGPVEWWLWSNAQRVMSIPKGAFRRHAGREVRRMTLTDRMYRYTGELAQPLFNDWFDLHGAKSLGIQQRGALIGVLPDGARPWYPTRDLPDAASIGAIPTSLSPMSREDAVAVIALGAQTASLALGMTAEDQDELKERIRTLLAEP